jgi:sugar phosphate isomerase/epimerase
MKKIQFVTVHGCDASRNTLLCNDFRLAGGLVRRERTSGGQAHRLNASISCRERLRRFFIIFLGAVLLGAVLLGSYQSAGAEDAELAESVFAKNNLVAWCIVPFDAKRRGPRQRAEMLQRLGITKLAYDWRQDDIPTFDEEIEQLKKHQIELTAFWYFCSDLQPEKQEHLKIILDVLARNRVKTQLWILLGDQPLAQMDQSGKVEAAARAIEYIAREADKIGCSVGLYNHGGWFGEPENQIAIVKRIGMHNVGIVYNFHHGHEHIERFGDMFQRMQPFLLAVNLNGMKRNGPKILPLGDGDRELGMLQIIRQSKYRGPIGILDHRSELDAEESLGQNLAGLQKLLGQMGDEQALKSY